MENQHRPEWFLKDLLRQVSRSFYLTLRALPSRLRLQVGLAYLFCRAADTIADTDLIPRTERLAALLFYRNQFFPASPDWRGIAELSGGSSGKALAGERLLLERLAGCFELLMALNEADRRLIGELVRTLTRGMEMDLLCFSEGRPGAPQELQEMADLDRYTYFVAGCVGEFWTRICRSRLTSLRTWDEGAMERLGVCFGKGLQMTNVLKDLSLDLARGRCYIPRVLLEKQGLVAKQLLDPASRSQVLPLVVELTHVALDHIDQGWIYFRSIPRREVRLRLACLWPLLFAIATLSEVLLSPYLLDPQRPVKFRRARVYQIMAISSIQIFSNSALRFYFTLMRRRLSRVLQEAGGTKGD